MPTAALRSLSHHMDLPWLREAFGRTRKDGAVGVDGQTAAQYAEDLEGNLESLLNRAKSGIYRAPPVRRVHIPKGDGRSTRPLGLPTFEDKVLQRAVVMLLEPVYEEDFYDFSFGFRPARSAHDALEVLDKHLWRMRGGWVLDVDIKSFFDNLDHEKLRSILRQRVVDLQRSSKVTHPCSSKVTRPEVGFGVGDLEIGQWQNRGASPGTGHDKGPCA